MKFGPKRSEEKLRKLQKTLPRVSLYKIKIVEEQPMCQNSASLYLYKFCLEFSSNKKDTMRHKYKHG